MNPQQRHSGRRCVCGVDGKAGEIAVDQIRTSSKSRLKRQLGRIDAAAVQELRQVIALLYVSD